MNIYLFSILSFLTEQLLFTCPSWISHHLGSSILEVRDDPQENATGGATLPGDTIDQPELESERSISYEIPPLIEESVVN